MAMTMVEQGFGRSQDLTRSWLVYLNILIYPHCRLSQVAFLYDDRIFVASVSRDPVYHPVRGKRAVH